MVREQDPFDAFYSYFGQGGQQAAITYIHQQAAVAVADKPDVAGVRPLEKFREPVCIRLLPPSGNGLSC